MMKTSSCPLSDGTDYKDTQCETLGCTRIGYQYAEISLPMEIEPRTELGDIMTECCGEPELRCQTCGDCGKCELIITQKICIKIPVSYNANVCAGKERIECDNCCHGICD